MTGLRGLLVAVAMVLVAAMASTATAGTPNLAPVKPLVGEAQSNNIIKVDRCHRRCRRSYSARWGRRVPHRHVGPNCRPRRCGRQYRVRPRYWRERCVQIGPVWYCD